jgi:hypothetical protein
MFLHKVNYHLLYLPSQFIVAQMAKLVDALPSGGSVRKDVLVRIQFWAQSRSNKMLRLFILSLKGDESLQRLVCEENRFSKWI